MATKGTMAKIWAVFSSFIFISLVIFAGINMWRGRYDQAAFELCLAIVIRLDRIEDRLP